MNDYGLRPDPLAVLYRTEDPEQAIWAVRELAAAGFADPLGIARDFGWEVSA